jgi:hypothetical protein
VEDSLGAHAVLRAGSAGGYVLYAKGWPIAPLDGAPDYRGTVEELCDPFARAFAITAFDLIENPQAPPEQDLRVELRVVPTRTLPDDRPAALDPEYMDTAYLGETYDVYARVHAAGDARVYLTAAVVGYTAPPGVLVFPDRSSIQAFPADGRWHRLWFGSTIGEPLGVDIIKVVVGPMPYDLNELIRSVPGCDFKGRGPSRPAEPQAPTQWTEIEHPVFFARRNP